MNIISLILEDCSDEEKSLIEPSLRQAICLQQADAIHSVLAGNPFLDCLETAKDNEDRHYERLADARERFFALHPARDDMGVTYFKGWWDAHGFGAVPFQDVPQYRFRGQDLEISDELLAKDRRYERREAQQKRQATWNRMRRSMRSEWRNSLTRQVKSG